MKKRVLPKVVDINKVLAEAKFNPSKDTILGIIAENGNLEYYLRKVVDVSKEVMANPTNPKTQENLTLAIRLLTLAKLQAPNESNSLLGTQGTGRENPL